MADRRISSERAREIGRLGKKASPWNNEPSACTKRAIESFNHHKRLHLIANIAQRVSKERL